jgi:hypothetical protein
MDQGIIQAMKLKYKCKQLSYLLKSMERNKDLSGPKLLKQISVLDAIYWIANSWSEVETSTIQKCYFRSGSSFQLKVKR